MSQFSRRQGHRSDVGEFPCRALKAGKTKFRLEVAHAKSLAVGFQDVMITISDRTQLPPATHPNEEGSTDRNRQLDKSEMKQVSKESDNRPPKRHATRMATGSPPPSKKPKKDDDGNDFTGEVERENNQWGSSCVIRRLGWFMALISFQCFSRLFMGENVIATVDFRHSYANGSSLAMLLCRFKIRCHSPFKPNTASGMHRFFPIRLDSTICYSD